MKKWEMIKKKLLSRKLWVSVSSFTSMMLVYFNTPKDKAESIASLIMAGASLIGYVIGEGLADGNSRAIDDDTYNGMMIDVNIPDINVIICKERDGD